MKPIEAEFIEPSKPPRALWWLLGALAMLPLALMWDTHRLREGARDRDTAASAEQARERAAQDARQAETAQRERNSPLAAQQRAFLMLREVAWPEALATLELAPRGAVTITAVEVDVPARTVSVEARSVDHQGVIDYLQRLNDGLPAGELRWRWQLKEVRQLPQAASYTVSIVADWGRG